MPLLRTPPEKGKIAKRPHTFDPENAFPDGTPLPPDLLTPGMVPSSALGSTQRSSQRSSQPDPTPTRGPSLKSALAAPASSLQPLDERAEQEQEQDAEEEMEIEKDLVDDKAMDVEPEAAAEPEPSAEPSAASISSTRAEAQPGAESHAPPPQTPPAAGPSTTQSSETHQPLVSQSTSQPPTQPLGTQEPTTPRRRSRRLTVNPDSPPTHVRPPANAFSTPGKGAPEPSTTPGRLTRSRTPGGPSTPPTRAELLDVPPIPIDDGAESAYGRYYEVLVRTLRINTLGQGLGRLTLEQMNECYPLLAKERPEGMRNNWEQMMEQVRTSTLEGAYHLFDEYRISRRLQMFADVVDEGIKWKEEHPGEARKDAWRPDLTPQMLSTAARLEVYDESWRVLREEYLALAQQCGERLQRVEEKRARLAALDNGVSDAVVELGKTNALFEDFPTTSMLEWAEDVGGD